MSRLDELIQELCPNGVTDVDRLMPPVSRFAAVVLVIKRNRQLLKN